MYWREKLGEGIATTVETWKVFFYLQVIQLHINEI
jgi:hypothetical protein